MPTHLNQLNNLRPPRRGETVVAIFLLYLFCFCLLAGLGRWSGIVLNEWLYCIVLALLTVGTYHMLVPDRLRPPALRRLEAMIEAAEVKPQEMVKAAFCQLGENQKYFYELRLEEMDSAYKKAEAANTNLFEKNRIGFLALMMWSRSRRDREHTPKIGIRFGMINALEKNSVRNFLLFSEPVSRVDLPEISLEGLNLIGNTNVLIFSSEDIKAYYKKNPNQFETLKGMVFKYQDLTEKIAVIYHGYGFLKAKEYVELYNKKYLKKGDEINYQQIDEEVKIELVAVEEKLKQATQQMETAEENIRKLNPEIKAVEEERLEKGQEQLSREFIKRDFELTEKVNNFSEAFCKAKLDLIEAASAKTALERVSTLIQKQQVVDNNPLQQRFDAASNKFSDGNTELLQKIKNAFEKKSEEYQDPVNLQLMTEPVVFIRADKTRSAYHDQLANALQYENKRDTNNMPFESFELDKAKQKEIEQFVSDYELIASIASASEDKLTEQSKKVKSYLNVQAEKLLGLDNEKLLGEVQRQIAISKASYGEVLSSGPSSSSGVRQRHHATNANANEHEAEGSNIKPGSCAEAVSSR